MKHQPYLDEIKKMELAEKFAEELPIFSEYILDNKIIKTDSYTKFGNKYRDLYLDWGINRYRLTSGTGYTITNYGKGEYDEVLWNIYINTISLFDMHKDFGLEELGKLDSVFFFDSTNSTFYIKDNGITEFLEELHNWYTNAKKEVLKIKTEKRKAELEKELLKLNTNN